MPAPTPMGTAMAMAPTVMTNVPSMAFSRPAAGAVGDGGEELDRKGGEAVDGDDADNVEQRADDQQQGDAAGDPAEVADNDALSSWAGRPGLRLLLADTERS